jgi:predicted amidohydrolase YtcJ
VLLIRSCHHIAVANSAALRAAGITRSTPDPEGGTFDRDEAGEPTGVVRETAMTMIRAAIGEPSEDEITRALQLGGRAFLETGVTSTAEAGIRRPEELRAYQRLWREGALPLRTYLMMMIDETLDHLIALGVQTGFGDERLRVGPAKLFTDGSIGAHTARMREPFEGTTDACGLWMEDPAAIKGKVLRAHRAGFQLGIHAIGDAAIDLILDSYEEAQRLDPRPDPRHRIEHCSIVDLETIRRIARLGVVPIPGTTFLHDFRDVYLQNLGEERIRYAYAMRTFDEEGVVAAASTDAPVCSVSATTGLQMMMTRHDVMGRPIWPEESIELHDALRAYTVNGAWASFEESRKGRLAPGMLGDVTVFETDLEATVPSDIASVRVDQTILDGHVVYSRQGA